MRKHMHVLRRLGKGSKSFYANRYKCVDPDCTFFASAEVVLGRRVICGVCLNQEGFIVPREQLFNRVPRCENCTTSKKVLKLKDIASELEFMLQQPREEQSSIIEDALTEE